MTLFGLIIGFNLLGIIHPQSEEKNTMTKRMKVSGTVAELVQDG